MAREVELTSESCNLARGGTDGDAEAYLPIVVERVLRDFYEVQLARHQRERERALRMGLSAPSAKWNRQALYIDQGLRQRALSVSRRHLVSHPEWWQGEGPSKLAEGALREVLAAQHFFQVDCDDLLLPPEHRRSEDAYGSEGGPYADVCEQLVLDAPRSSFEVEGQRFDFATEMARAGALEQSENLEGCGADEGDQCQQAFTERLILAVRRCLSGNGEPPPLLLRAVSTLLSQSGMASLERACDTSQVVVSGGEQHVRYALRAIPACENPVALAGGSCGPLWEVRLLMRKEGFHHCIAYGSQEQHLQEDPAPLACGLGSVVEKSCRLHVSLSPLGERVEVDVVELRKDVRLLGMDGRLLRLPGHAATGRQPRAFAAAGLLFTACKRCAGSSCCRPCRGFSASVGLVLQACARAGARWRRRLSKRDGAP